MKRLAGMTALVIAGAVVFSQAGETVKTSVDDNILTYIAVVYTIGVAIMLAYTRSWSLIGCGLLATMTGDAILYGRASGHLPVPNGAWVLDVVRSCFVVGGSYLLIGLVLWVREQRRGEAVLVQDGAP